GMHGSPLKGDRKFKPGYDLAEKSPRFRGLFFWLHFDVSMAAEASFTIAGVAR
ncbi:MAG: hypothetical protein JWM36_623, partial [Hyphomicrobiales bacterium]|nr:hypothetical protein [Hyphomicrobiales bacterium]